MRLSWLERVVVFGGSVQAITGVCGRLRRRAVVLGELAILRNFGLHINHSTDFVIGRHTRLAKFVSNPDESSSFTQLIL